jgi:hypothetical protein
MQRSVIDRGNRMPQVSNVEVVSYRCVCVEDSEGEGLRWRRQQRVKSAAMCVGCGHSSCSVPKFFYPGRVVNTVFFVLIICFVILKLIETSGSAVSHYFFWHFQWIYFKSRHQVMKILAPEQSDGSERLWNPPRFSESGVWGHSDTLH